MTNKYRSAQCLFLVAIELISDVHFCMVVLQDCVKHIDGAKVHGCVCYTSGSTDKHQQSQLEHNLLEEILQWLLQLLTKIKYVTWQGCSVREIKW